MQRAILVNPPKPTERHISSKYLEPALSNPGNQRFRPITTGNLHTLYNLVVSGDYVFRFAAYTKRKGVEPVKASVTINGKEVKALEITSTDEKKPMVVELPLRIEKGERRIAVNFVNPSKKGDGEPLMLLVDYFALKGPLDTRPESQFRLLKCDASKPKPEQTREILTRFMSKAYRRPAAKDEVDRLTKLVEAVEKRGEKWEAGLQLAMQAVLVSPKFLFRVELDSRPDSAEMHPIDEFQLVFPAIVLPVVHHAGSGVDEPCRLKEATHGEYRCPGQENACAIQGRAARR